MKQGWEKKKLKDISYVIMGQSPSSTSYNDKEIGYPLLNGAADYKGQIFNPKKYTNAPTRLAEKNDILLGIRATIGNIAISDQTYCIGRGVAAIRVNEQKAHRNYIKNYLVSALDEIIGKSGGAIIKGIKKEDLTDMIIYLPDVNEQKRIVTKLDECFEAIDKARANVEKNLNNAKELFQSQLNEIFSQKGDGWVEKRWGDLCQFVRGPFGGSLKKSMFKESGYVVYEQKHAIHDHFNQLRYFIDEEKFNEMKRFEVKPGDLIMSCSGVTLGKVAIIPEGIQKGIINQALLKLTPYDNILAEFLKYWIRSKIFQDIIFKYSGGAAIPNVPSAKILKGIMVSIPNINIQKDIIREIELFESQTQSLKSNYQQELNALDELKKSILQKAFNGEL